MIQKSKLGQNFLNDEAAIARIAAAVGAVAGRTVVEIGPGMGAITESLAARAGRLVAVEYDHQLAIRLKVILVSALRLSKRTCSSSTLRTRPSKPVSGWRGRQPALLHYFAHSASAGRGSCRVEVAVLMVQREVADRVVAQPGSRDYGLLSVTTQMYGATERLFTLPPSAFTPPPEVHSTVFRWRLASRFEELGVEPAPFLRLIQLAFAQKRKTLANNLRAAGIEPTVAAEALAKAELEPLARAESLSLIDFASLCGRLYKRTRFLLRRKSNSGPLTAPLNRAGAGESAAQSGRLYGPESASKSPLHPRQRVVPVVERLHIAAHGCLRIARHGKADTHIRPPIPIQIDLFANLRR